MIAMGGEIILLVVGVPSNYFDPPPRGILLRQLSGDPDTVGGTFKLQE